MKIAQTYYYTGSLDQLLYSNFGWLSNRMNIISWYFSILQLRKYYCDVTLYCSLPVKELFCDILDLPYSNYITINSDENELLKDPDLWALSKLITYKKQTSPFLHVDGDFFLNKKFPSWFESSNLCAQNIELNSTYYKLSLDNILSVFQFTPTFLIPKENKPIISHNMGVFGGKDLQFIHEYADASLIFINENKSIFDRIDKYTFNSIFEQYFSFRMAIKENKSFAYLANGRNKKTLEEIVTPWKPFSMTIFKHPYGINKKSHYVNKFLEDLFSQKHKSEYAKILSLYKEPLLISTNKRKLPKTSNRYYLAQINSIKNAINNSGFNLKSKSKLIQDLNALENKVHHLASKLPLSSNQCRSVKQQILKPTTLNWRIELYDSGHSVTTQNNSADILVSTKYNWASLIRSNITFGMYNLQDIDRRPKSNYYLIQLDNLDKSLYLCELNSIQQALIINFNKTLSSQLFIKYCKEIIKHYTTQSNPKKETLFAILDVLFITGYFRVVKS